VPTHLDACLDHLREGDVLTVWKLDRLGRNTQHVLAVVAIAAFALVLASLPLTELASPPLSRADDGCGPGMSYNYETLDCEPWVEVNPYIDPYIPVLPLI
jgi:hypothetical protein